MEDDAVLIDEDTQEKLDLNFHTDMPVGEILRRTRVYYGQSLQQVEAVLRIRASQLDALERGDIAQLPGRVYAIGFVRSYSEYLGLDGDKMVHLFKEQSVGRQKKPDLSFPVPASESRVPSLRTILISLAGVLLLIGFITFLMYPEPPRQSVPPVPQSLTTSKLNEAPALVAAPPVQTPAKAEIAPSTGAASGANNNPQPQPPATRLMVEISEPSWVEIRNAQGAAVLRQVLKPGDIYLVPNEKGLVMATGNAGGVRLRVDGQLFAPLGQSGEIRRKIPLDPDILKTRIRSP